jgi:hypothetical protein
VLGIVASQLLAILIVTGNNVREEFSTLLLVQFIFSAVTTLMAFLLLEERPAKAPSRTAQERVDGPAVSVLILLRDHSYIKEVSRSDPVIPLRKT